MKNKKFLGFVVVAVVVLSAMALHAWTISLPRTGQTGCWDATGASISCTGTGQDGEFLNGTAWPSPRFTSATNTMTDNLTGLMWFRAGNTPTIGSCTGGVMNWTSALTYVACLNSAAAYGFTDWRLPNVAEINMLINANEFGSGVYTWLTAQGFTSMQVGSSVFYWTNTTYANQPQKAWVITLREQKVNEPSSAATKSTATSRYILPVRGGII
jgi:hypothetical protein